MNLQLSQKQWILVLRYLRSLDRENLIDLAFSGMTSMQGLEIITTFRLDDTAL